MLILIPALLSTLALSATGSGPADVVAAQEAETETRVETWPDGSKKLEQELVRGADGELVLHGVSRSWHPGGVLESEARYQDGWRSGLWTTYHPSGEKVLDQHVRGLHQGPVGGHHGVDDLLAIHRAVVVDILLDHDVDSLGPDRDLGSVVGGVDPSGSINGCPPHSTPMWEEWSTPTPLMCPRQVRLCA